MTKNTEFLWHIDTEAHGFTLIELVIIIALTVLIGAVGISGLDTYIVRAQIADAVMQAAATQEQVAQAFRATGTPPADRQSAGLSAAPSDSSSDQIESIDIANGRIEIRFGHAANPAIVGRTLSLTPFETADQQVVWICGNKPPGVGLNPLGFAGGGNQSAQVVTTIEARYLPSTCR